MRVYKAGMELDCEGMGSRLERYVLQEILHSKLNIVIVDGCRTPIGCFRWALSSFSAVQLGAVVIRTALERANIPSDLVDTVYFGNILPGGVGQNCARQAAIHAGIPYNVCATTVTRSCSSGLVAIQLGIKSILTGNAKIVIAGGTEAVSKAPYLVPRVLDTNGHQKFIDEIAADAMYDPWFEAHPERAPEKTASDYGITREDQDNFACESYRRSKEAMKNGIFKREIVPLTTPDGDVVDQDEEPNKFNKKKMFAMKPAFKPDGTLTAGNVSSLADGAAAVVLTTQENASQLGLIPKARIIGYADEAIDPVDFNIAAVKSMNKLLEDCNVKKDAIARWEISEAYSITTLAAMKAMQLDHSKVNIHGGCVSLGHPFAATGCRLPVHLIYSLNQGELGMIGLCNGGGEATALLIEKL